MKLETESEATTSDTVNGEKESVVPQGNILRPSLGKEELEVDSEDFF